MPDTTIQKRPNTSSAGALMIMFLFLSRFLGLFRSTIMSSKFSIGINTDAYRLAFQIPDLLFFLIAGGALSSAFIPVFSELLHTDREEQAWELFSVVTTLMSLIVLVFILVAWIFAPQLTAFMAQGKDPSIFPLIVRMSRIVLPAQFAFFIGGLMFGTLYARQKFIYPGLAPNLYNLGIIFGALFLSTFVTPGIVGMSWGALCGAIVGNLVLPLIAMRSIGAKFKPSLNLQAEGVKRVFKLMIPVILGLSLPQVYSLIMQKFGSQYPNGVNTSLDLSNTLMQAPLGIFGQSLALAAFPALTQFFAQKRMDLYKDQLAKSLRQVLYLSVPSSVILFVLAPQIVNLAFGYGKTSADLLPPVVNCLRMFCIGIFAWCMQPTLMRAFFAIQKSVKPIIIGTLTTSFFILLYFLLKGSLGYLALPLAGSLAAVALCIVMCTAVYLEIDGYDIKSIIETFIKSLIASAVAGLFCYLVFKVAPHHAGKIVLLGLFLVTFCAAGWIYYFITKALKMPETDYISRAMKRLDRRRPITPLEAGDE